MPRSPDDWLDLAFSFDSLVHAEHDALAGYLGGLATKLKPGGTAVLHHSNLGQFGYFRGLHTIKRWLGASDPVGPASDSATVDPGSWRRLVSAMGRAAMGSGVLDRTHLRAVSVSAERVRELAISHGLSCISQELFPWGGSRRPIDCISVLTRDGAASQEGRRLVKSDFMREADRVKRIGELYD